MKNMMKYEGYLGSAHFDEETRLYQGKLEFIKAQVLYEAENEEELVNAFHQAVEDYLTACHEKGIKPEKPFHSTFKSLFANRNNQA
ncbi:MAG: type II toxin-antitoxin system HicB family antitoxin [Candidatus Parabeggiatoa sp.]|nr:type II toxin-antitoxin system HicB family antitoxin [Candidatus Parabeggiatoa sp.]